MADAILTLSKINKIYNAGEPSEVAVLHDIDLEIKKGEFVAIMGPSGSGKSTLLNIIGLLDRPSSGHLSINGQDTSMLDDTELTHLRGHRIGFVFQYHYLISAFTVLENVMMPQLIAGVASGVARTKAAGLLTEMGLRERLNHRPAALSGGEQQRVAIARALANDPAVLLADEPTGNLDAMTADSVFELLKHTAKEKKIAMLVATHNLDLARRMDRITQLENGALK